MPFHQDVNVGMSCVLMLAMVRFAGGCGRLSAESSYWRTYILRTPFCSMIVRTSSGTVPRSSPMMTLRDRCDSIASTAYIASAGYFTYTPSAASAPSGIQKRRLSAIT